MSIQRLEYSLYLERFELIQQLKSYLCLNSLGVYLRDANLAKFKSILFEQFRH